MKKTLTFDACEKRMSIFLVDGDEFPHGEYKIDEVDSTDNSIALHIDGARAWFFEDPEGWGEEGDYRIDRFVYEVSGAIRHL